MEGARYVSETLSDSNRQILRRDDEAHLGQAKIKTWQILVEPMTEMVASQHRRTNTNNSGRKFEFGDSNGRGKRGRSLRRRPTDVKLEASGNFKLYTFVPDKRMSSFTSLDSLDSESGEFSSPKRPSENDQRKNLNKDSLLTFHQLAFHGDTLKAYDTSVFVVRREVQSKPPRLVSKQKNRKRIGSVVGMRPATSNLREAAEVLLGLRSDTDLSTEYNFDKLALPKATQLVLFNKTPESTD